MKKNGFIEGAMIATVSVILCKILGLIYVIPFYSIIGTQGGALYSYAYSIYAIFLSLATSGIPVAISKVISEYHALGYENLKERAFKVGKYIIVGLGVVSFLILFIFAPQVAYLIIGDITGGNTIEGVTLVIRVVSTAILVVPLASVSRGYLQGQKYMTVPNLTTVVEQLVRVIVIVAGSFLSLKVFHLSLNTAVGIAVFGATAGAIASYFFLSYHIRKNRDKLKRDAVSTREEARVTNKALAKKIVFYAIPFIVIDLIRSAFNMVDVFTVVKTLVNMGYSTGDAESIIGAMTTWGSKLTSIVMSVVIGMTVAIVPNIMSSFVKKDYKDISKKINQSLQILLITTVPMTVGLSFLAGPVWTVFYGGNLLGISMFRVYIFTALTFTFYSILVDTTQTMNNTKVAVGTLVFMLILKSVINIPMMHLFNSIGLDAYYGPMAATMLTQIIAFSILIHNLTKQCGVKYKASLNTLLKTVLCTAIMFVVLMILKLFIPLTIESRMQSLLVCIIYASVGILVYGVVAFKSKMIEEIVGKEKLDSLLRKFHLKK